MKSEKGIIEIFVIGIVIILFIILFTAIGIMIKEEKDYGVKEVQLQINLKGENNAKKD